MRGEKRSEWLAAALVVLLMVPPAAAQDEEYEFEPGEGVHEEEWYDPSDWFNDDGRIDNESEADVGLDFGYFDPYGLYYTEPYGDYEYDFQGDEYTNAWDYTHRYEAGEAWGDLTWMAWDDYDYDVDFARDVASGDVEYDWGREVEGEVVSVERVAARNGRPASVRLVVETTDGEERSVMLGDVGYVEENATELHEGETVTIAGRRVTRDGKKLFKVAQVVTADDRIDVPDYRYNQTLRGRITGLRVVRASERGDVASVIARVRTREGRTMDVMLGSPDRFDGGGPRLSPGTRIDVEGYLRTTNGYRTFVIQDVDLVAQD